MFSLLSTNPLYFVVWVISFVLVVSVHEYAHALAAYLQGDYTAKYEGRLTLNPLAHLDFMGTLLVLFVGFGWGKPVPFNPYNLKNHRWGPAIVSIAGPLSNIVLFIIAVVGYRVTVGWVGPDNLGSIFWIVLATLSLGLALFNLIPVPPLDGSKILMAILPDRFFNFKVQLETYGPFILLGLILFGDQLFVALSNLSQYAVNVFMFTP